MERRQDVLLGLAFTLLGAAAAYKGLDYPGASGRYPAALGVVLAILGGTVALRALVAGHDRVRPLMDNPRNLALAVTSGAVYIALVPVLGFFTASTLLLIVMPTALGLRRPILILTAAVVLVAMIYVIFTVVLEKPLPAELWHPSRWAEGLSDVIPA